MSILRYLKPITGNNLPTPDEVGLSPSITKEVNQLVERATAGNRRVPDDGTKMKKRKYTVSFMPEDRATIGKYAAENSNGAAIKRFKASHDIGESTMRLFKKRYLEEIRKHHVRGTQFKDMTSLPRSKRGRKVMLGEQLNCKVQNYIKGFAQCWITNRFQCGNGSC